MSPRAALVTGAGRRIGRALALRLAETGYDVAVHHRGGAADAERVVQEIETLGRRAAAVHADLSDEAEAATLVSRAAGALGPLTLLVNNASVFRDDRVGGLTHESWEAHMQVNLRAPVVLAEAFAAQAPEAGDTDPSVINILDQRVLKPNPQFFSYSLSKAALWFATRTLAQALAPKVRVNGLGPGPTLPSIHQSSHEFQAEAAAVPLGHGVRAEDICEAALYLARARAVTGQMLAVDSGQHLAWRTADILQD